MKAGKSLAAISTAAVASLVMAASASADTVVVHDDGDSTISTTCTLRHAMDSLSSGTPSGGCVITPASGNDAISFDPSITDIQLADGELIWNGADPLSIAGPGISLLSIAADPQNRVFNVQSGTLTISGMTIRDGAPSTAAQVRGGCVLNDGTLTLSGVRLTNCTSNGASNSTHTYADGAAVGNEGTLTINDSRVDNNHTTATNTKTGSGGTEAQARGAIYSEGAGGVTLDNTTVEENDTTATDADDGNSDALAVGGVAVLAGGSMSISRSTFELNSATASEANGIAITAGAIYSDRPGSIELTTIARNFETTTGGPAIQPGGGVLNEGSLAIRSSTIALNGPAIPSGPSDGANLQVRGATNLSNTILANPRGGGANCAGLSALSDGFNVDFSTSGPSCISLPDPTTLTSDPLLSPDGPVNNGGPTETIALQPTSPAIDAGRRYPPSPETQDQRGLTRPVDFSGIANASGGDGTDIGAFEVQLACAGQATPTTACPSGGGAPPSAAPGPTGQRAAALKKCKKLKGKAKAKKRRKCIKRAKKLPV